MRIAVVGATGQIGAKLTQNLLNAGHQVRAMSRGGKALDALVAKGAEPFIGSFDTGAGELSKFFQDIDAAFLMVKTDWNNIDSHYQLVSQRFFDALELSSVNLAVSLSAFGAEIDGETGHSKSFHILEEKLNELHGINLLHLRAAWFMENTVAWAASVAKYDRIAWFPRPDVKMPWVDTGDIADLAAKELTQPISGHRVIREAGSEDLTMVELAAIIGRETGRSIDYRTIDRDRSDIEAVFIERFGTPDRWLDDTHSANAINNGMVKFHDVGTPLRPILPTRMEAFIRYSWKPHYDKEIAQESQPESFYTWSARPELFVSQPSWRSLARV